MMINIEFSTSEGFTLLTCMRYLFASIQDVEKIEDEQEKKDVELEYYRSVANMESIKDEDMAAMISKLEEIRVALIKEGEPDASDLGIIETVKDDNNDTLSS